MRALISILWSRTWAPSFNLKLRERRPNHPYCRLVVQETASYSTGQVKLNNYIIVCQVIKFAQKLDGTTCNKVIARISLTWLRGTGLE